MHSILGAMLRSSNAVLNISKAAGSHATFLKAASFATYASPEETWQALFNSPSEWEDMRPVKEAGGNPKLPDFRQKASQSADGERTPALWIDSRGTPAWVAEKLPSLAVQAVQSRGQGKASSSASSDEAQWKSLFDNPSEWEDLRPVKEAGGNPRLPDFRKAGGVPGEFSPALWIDSRGVPAWVAEKLPSLKVLPAQVKKR